MTNKAPKKNTSPIILIGFKHTGKSILGSLTAQKLGYEFIDLDQHIINLFQLNYHQPLTCREIMSNYSENFFRGLEHQALKYCFDAHITPAQKQIISLGGGTVCGEYGALNQHLIKSSFIIWITACRDIVYDRILASGQPAFFSDNKGPYQTFNSLWQEREKIYKSLADRQIDNSGLIKTAARKLIECIQHDC